MRKLTKKEFIDRAKCILGNNYDFTKTTYINSHIKTIITCKLHGDFLIYPKHVLNRSQGCPECSKKILSKIKTLTLQEFVKRANCVHKYKYDYSFGKYINSSTKIKIICPIHGPFWQTPNNHLKGFGCPNC